MFSTDGKWLAVGSGQEVAVVTIYSWPGLEKRAELGGHTHLVHADAYGQTAGMLAGVPVRLSTKHGFNEFREGPLFAFGDRMIGALAHRQIAISRGLARYLAETEGFPEPDFEIVHYGIAAGPEPTPYEGDQLRFLLSFHTH